jgi:hypothetical protein
MLKRAASNTRRASLVRSAKAAWHKREYQAAARFYYRTEWAPPSGRLSGLFLRYC